MSSSDISTISEMSIPMEEEELPNLGMYIGERNFESQRHGRGWAILPNGDQYDGQYRKGKRHGCGLYVFKSGARYFGLYRCGQRAGRGMFVYPDGTLYEGNWRRNLKHGKGRYTYPNGDTYVGDWHRGERHGVGIYTYFASLPSYCRLRFKGTWVRGERAGPFQAFLGDDERCITLHGIWKDQFPIGPAVFNFDQRYILTGFFKYPPFRKNAFPDATQQANQHKGKNDGQNIGERPTKWYAQDICVYDYSLLPHQPVPLPLSDSEVSICSLSTTPGELPADKDLDFIDGEGEEEGEFECWPCECGMSGIETSSSLSAHALGVDPCAIDMVSKKRDCD